MAIGNHTRPITSVTTSIMLEELKSSSKYVVRPTSSHTDFGGSHNEPCRQPTATHILPFAQAGSTLVLWHTLPLVLDGAFGLPNAIPQ